MLDVLYEDESLLFINKPAGVVIQPSLNPSEPYLLAEVMEHAPGAFLMQRLDKGTSGVMFFSKMSAINAKLTRQKGEPSNVCTQCDRDHTRSVE